MVVLWPLAPWLGSVAFRDITSGAPRTERLVFVAASAVVAAARGRCPRSAGRRGASGRFPYCGRFSEMRARAALSAPPASRAALAALWPLFLLYQVRTCARAQLAEQTTSL